MSEATGHVVATEDPARPDDPTTAEPVAPASPPSRRWLRRIGIVAVLVLAIVAIGFQVQVHRVDEQAAEAEARQRAAQLDARTARDRLESVDARVRTAEAAEARAQRTLEGSRTAMAAQDLDEAGLDDVRVETAGQVKELRRGVRSVERQIEEQGRLQPAAGACLFDLLRALGQVGDVHRSGPRSEACTTVAGTRGPG